MSGKGLAEKHISLINEGHLSSRTCAVNGRHAKTENTKIEFQNFSKSKWFVRQTRELLPGKTIARSSDEDQMACSKGGERIYGGGAFHAMQADTDRLRSVYVGKR